MTPVVRISDEVFRRLQKFGEPLVDTTSRVIDRLIDHYEFTRGPVPVTPPTSVTAASQLAGSAAHSAPQLFLAPARQANLHTTIERSVTVAEAKPYLTDSQFAELSAAIGGTHAFRCYAMTESRRSVFDAMRPRDHVLLTPTAAGQFTVSTRVVHKMDSEPLGRRLWPEQPGLPWRLIYVLNEFQKRAVRKDRLFREFNYSATFILRGISRVRPEVLQKALERHSDIETLLESCSG